MPKAGDMKRLFIACFILMGVRLSAETLPLKVEVVNERAHFEVSENKKLSVTITNESMNDIELTPLIEPYLKNFHLVINQKVESTQREADGDTSRPLLPPLVALSTPSNNDWLLIPPNQSKTYEVILDNELKEPGEYEIQFEYNNKVFLPTKGKYASNHRWESNVVKINIYDVTGFDSILKKYELELAEWYKLSGERNALSFLENQLMKSMQNIDSDAIDLSFLRMLYVLKKRSEK